MSFTYPDVPAPHNYEAAQPASPSAESMTCIQLRERARRLPAECLELSPCDRDVWDAIGSAIGEMTDLTECVLRLMPVDSQALTDRLVEARDTLIRLMDDVEQADERTMMRRAGSEDGYGKRRDHRGRPLAGCDHQGLLSGWDRRRAHEHTAPAKARPWRSGRCACVAMRPHGDARGDA